MTKIVNKFHHPYDTYIGRGSLWGNQFVIGKDGSREEVIAKYKVWFYQKLKTDETFRKETLKLKNRTLGCFCKPKPCHGDIICEFLNSDAAQA